MITYDRVSTGEEGASQRFVNKNTENDNETGELALWWLTQQVAEPEPEPTSLAEYTAVYCDLPVEQVMSVL